MEKITIHLVCLEGDRALALNYLKKPAVWESGKVLDVDVKVYPDRRTSPTYRVVLDRRSSTGKLIFIYVGDDRIKKV